MGYFTEHLHVDADSDTSNISASVYPANKRSGDSKVGWFVVVLDDDPTGVNKDIQVRCEGTVHETLADWIRMHNGNIDQAPSFAGSHGLLAFYQSVGSGKHVFAFEVTLMPIVRSRVVAVVSSTNVVNTFLVF